ncbi:OmpP1/FadL family transporter [Pedobacter sp. L105]|uniref:OmpP1/FadL family transporter n=1 Tax=Pedobacter sp. L105 TaxID=1641871 RepID=UPI00131EBB4D|nr:outer membrane protein transport protein [Pedobacter sp. L105]
MKKIIQLLVVAIVGTTGNIYAQSGIYAGDALRFSRTDYGSSSRFKGLGNAQISLGGDISSISGNPAGLGMFTRSEFSVTPELDNTKANSNYLGQNTKSTKTQFNLNNAAAVWYNPVIKPRGSDLNKGLLSVVYGIGYNRTNDFSSSYNYSGNNPKSSIADAFAEQANGTTPGNLSGIAGQAYDSFLIDKQLGTTNQYYPATSLNNTQTQREVRQGSTSELDFSAGMNISNKLYLGASIGFVDVRYESNKQYTESGTIISNPSNAASTDNSDHANPYVGSNYNLNYSSYQNTTGSGINARLGIIYKPTSILRVGATFQAPTWMHMEEDYSEILNSNITGTSANPAGTTSNNDFLNSSFNYNVRTPYKGSLGASVILGKNALISADVDYVNYASTRLSESDGYGDLIDENNAYIKQNYTHAFNYRVGGEYRIQSFSIRAGYGVNGSPYKGDDNNTFDVKYYSAGLGYRIGMYYMDIAYQRTTTHNTFSPYELNDFSEPIATTKLDKNNMFLTVGVRF